MKIIDRRCGWTAVGTEVGRIPAMALPTADEMLAYYHLEPGCAKYVYYSAANRFERVILKKLNGEFLIVPINPDVYVLER